MNHPRTKRDPRRAAVYVAALCWMGLVSATCVPTPHAWALQPAASSEAAVEIVTRSVNEERERSPADASGYDFFRCSIESTNPESDDLPSGPEPPPAEPARDESVPEIDVGDPLPPDALIDDGTLEDVRRPSEDRPRLPDEPARPDSTIGAKSIESPREYLEMAGIDRSHLDALRDGRPLHPDELETLRMILVRLPGIDLDMAERWCRTDVEWTELAEMPEEFRPEIFRLSGRVVEVIPHRLPDELARRFGFEHYYNVAFDVDGTDVPCTVLARSVPMGWKKALAAGEKLGERATALGMFLKVGDSSGKRPELVFATNRVGWFAEKVDATMGVEPEHVFLSDLGMDVGLLELARDRKALLGQDHEPFYQLLAAVGRAGPGQMAAAARDDVEFEQLLTDPEDQHGRIFTISGTARRAVKIVLGESDADVKERFGIDHYYELDVLVPLRKTITIKGTKKSFDDYPVMFCVRHLPEGMPQGENIHEPVRVSGAYFKLWAYKSQYMSQDDGPVDGELSPPDAPPVARRQASPLLIGYTAEWVPNRRERNARMGMLFGGFFIVATLGVWLGLWRYSRSDRRFERSTLSRQFEVGENESLDKMDLPDAKEPDFRNLE